MLSTKPDAQLLDVRTAEEVAEGSIEGAVNYDFYQDDFRKKLESLNPQKPTFVYCRSGGRSGQTMDILKELGFVEIYDLEGGYTVWSTKN